ncbi:MAG: hypothetical protein AAF438_10970 [Pseudomonadota bacterium]
MRGLTLGLLLVLMCLPLGVQGEESIKQLFLLQEDGRLVVSNNKFSRFDELKLNAREKVLDTLEANSVAVIYTNQRIIGYGVLSGFRDIKTEAGERLAELKGEDYAALVVTSRRLLNFNGKSGVWGERKRSK